MPRNAHDAVVTTTIPAALLNTLAMLLRCFMMRLDTIPNAASVSTTHHVAASNPRSERPSPPYPYAATSPLAATPKAYNCAFCRCMLVWKSPL